MILGKLWRNAILKLLHNRQNVFLLHHIEVHVYEHLHQQHTIASINNASMSRNHIAKVLKCTKFNWCVWNAILKCVEKVYIVFKRIWFKSYLSFACSLKPRSKKPSKRTKSCSKYTNKQSMNPDEWNQFRLQTGQ